MAFIVPQRRRLQPIEVPRNPPVPIDQIIAVRGQNPLAMGISQVGDTLSKSVDAVSSVLAKRAQLQRQGQQVAQLAQMTGQQPPDQSAGPSGMDPDTYLKALQTKATMEKDSTDRAIYLQILRNQGGIDKVQASTGGKVGKKNFVGLDANGQPLLMDEQGNFSRGNVPGGGTVLSKTSSTPTSQTRSTAEFANTLLPHIQQMRNLIQQADAQGYIGPAAGRIYGDFMAGKVGSTGDQNADQLLGQLRATDSLLKTGAMKVHFGARGGGQMYDHFSDMLNTGKQSAAMLNGSLDGIQSFMQGYADAGIGGSKAGSLPTLKMPAKKVGRFQVEIE